MEKFKKYIENFIKEREDFDYDDLEVAVNQLPLMLLTMFLYDKNIISHKELEEYMSNSDNCIRAFESIINSKKTL